MKNAWKIVIVLLLAASVVAVVLQKKSQSRSGEYQMTVNDSNIAAAQTQQTNQSAKLPRLVDLGADKCIPCKIMAPILKELKSQYQGKLEVVFIDVWEKPDEAKKYGIKLIPTQIFYNASGKELYRHEGFFSKEDILGKWKEFGIKLEKGIQSDINDIISKQPQQMQQELNNNAFFVLEQEATRRILQHLAKESVTQSDKVKPNQEDPNILQQFFEKDVFKKIEVTDEELKTFYENNKDMCGGATLDQIGSSLKEYLIDQKKQQMADDYIHTLGKKISIQVSDSWVKKQAALAFDNPVDKARKSGKPSMVDFGASGCRPCDMMAPILETLRKKYEGKCNVIFIHVREQQILASRYGVQAIPLQVFFDKTGKEVFRHVGFFPQGEIEKKINELAVK